MHVLHIGIYPPPYGGISTHIYRIKRFLEDSDREISCSVIDWSGYLHPTKQTEKSISILTGSRFARWIKLLPLINHLKPDIIHVHISSGKSFHWVAGPILLSPSAKKFVTVHSSSFVKSGGLYRPYVKRLLNRMDQIIVVNETVYKAILDSNEVSTPICVIPAYIDPQVQELSNTDQELEELVKNTKAKFKKIVLISGFVTPDYSFDKALDALEMMSRKDVCLFIVGYNQVDSDYYAHLQTRVNAFNGRALWLENLPHASFLYLLSVSGDRRSIIVSANYTTRP